MHARVKRLIGLGTVALLVAGVALTRRAWVQPLHARASTSREPGFSERSNRDVQIKVWNQALDADPTSALVMGQLAALHLQRAREGGSWDDYLKAEDFARRSLSKRTNRNASTASTLVSILLAQHRFTEARVVAEELVSRDPETPEYRATLGEVAMELGDYAAADTLFQSVWKDRGTLTIAARLARWLELNNHVPEARRLLNSARETALARRDVAMETKAWFALRLGDLELRNGHFRKAEESFNAGLTIEPDDPRLLSAMARLAAAQGNDADVVMWGERAIGLQLDPATLGLVGDAYAAMGNAAKANEYLSTLEVAVSLQPGAYHRAWSLYLLDHRLQIEQVLARAQEELRERKDIYGYDIVAWALEKAGRRDDARVAMQQALRLGTRDPLLTRHAAALGLVLPSDTEGEQ
jgi:tetratricopeptide (TPR) repeat protein